MQSNPLELLNCHQLTISAGIVGDVTYSSSRSEAANLGGLGAIVGHEISHAFDDSGSQYDENGNKNNWWTTEDSAKFKQIQNKLIAYSGSNDVKYSFK